jgi:peptide/nickel transport system permease protein
MLRYTIRRILQMIPTVLGVILITFALFNVVGGSPAAMTLGKHVSPKLLEDFDEQRGFNKPLVFGWWVRTRALPDADLRKNPGPWRGVEGVDWQGEQSEAPLRMAAGREVNLPLAFALRPQTRYRLLVEYAQPPAETAGAPAAVIFPNLGKVELPFSKPWKKVTLDFQTLEKPTPTDVRLAAGAVDLRIRSIRLRRRMANPWDSQLWFYFRQLARFDFGVSSSLNQPVSRLLRAGIGPSLLLTTPIFFAELLIAICLALICAFFRDSVWDRAIVVLSVALMSVNYLVWIVAGQYVLGYKWGWFPVWGFESWRYLLLPVIIGTFSGLGGSVRFYRTIMLDEMHKDYVRTAFAKGVSKAGVLFRHVLKNAMIPIVTNVIVAIPFLYTGSLLLESFFGIPGLGYLGVNAINSWDVDVVRALVLIGSLLFVAANLVTDLCYAWLTRG